ncbi:hypothetical protein ACILDU_09650 [Capnocytophaga canimorsus]|uniref:hypothetical protein n=1 Tax=Capnocytophaga canimorsus TaxID=28188 RepID=UPI0037CF21FA
MRKFILSMALAIVSVGAYAQVTTGCNPDQNKPEIGATYTYQVNTNTNGFTGNGHYLWYVTQNTNLLDENSKIEANNDNFSVENAATNYNKNVTVNSLQIKWKPDALTSATPFYLVVKYTEEKNGCPATNIKAMEIKPLNKFTLDITPVSDNSGTTFNGDPKVCSADITSATIEGSKVKYIYGQNKLYYKVTMTGFAGEWKPTITLPELAGKDGVETQAVGRKYVSLKWNGITANTFEDFGNLTNNGELQTITSTNKTNKNEFILEVTIDNGTYEGLTDEDVQVATKGNMVLANGDLGKRDVDNNCNELTDGNNKKASQKILARPTITPAQGNFIIQIQ